MMVTSAVEVSIGTGKKTVDSSTLNFSIPSNAVSSSMITMLTHSSVAPGNMNETDCPLTKSSPRKDHITIHAIKSVVHAVVVVTNM